MRCWNRSSGVLKPTSSQPNDCMADDYTTVPVLAKGKTRHRRDVGFTCGRRSVLPVRRKTVPPAAMFYYSRDRAGEPSSSLLILANSRWDFLRSDAYGGYNKLYEPENRKPGLRSLEAACWVHARRSFFILADVAAGECPSQGTRRTPAPISPLRLLEGGPSHRRPVRDRTLHQCRLRQCRAAPRCQAAAQCTIGHRSGTLWMREQRAKLSRGNEVAKAMEYMLKRWTAFTRFLDDGRICLSNNAAELEALRGIALGIESRGSIRRLRSRRTARCSHVQHHCHGKNERRRSSKLRLADAF